MRKAELKLMRVREKALRCLRGEARPLRSKLIAIRVSDAEHDALIYLAKRRDLGRSVNNVLRLAINAMIETNPVLPPKLRDRALRGNRSAHVKNVR